MVDLLEVERAEEDRRGHGGEAVEVAEGDGRPAQDPQRHVVLYNAVPGTDTLQKPQWLASPESRRAAMRPLAG